MLKRISATTLLGFAMVTGASSFGQTNLSAKVGSLRPTANAPVETDRTKDGLVGPVRRVRTEVVKLTGSGSEGRISEGKRALLEIVAYDIKGNKTENQYFPVTGSTLTGKESYKYDDKGNISEMVLMNDDGSLLSKESYRYEFDFAGNWNKMTTSVAVIDSGKMSFEPTEITYRSIMYYLDENMVKMSQPGSQPAAQPTVAAAVPSNVTNNVANSPKTTESDAKQPSTVNKVASLPPSSVSGEKLSSVNTAEVKNIVSNSANSLKVVVDSEPPPSSTPTGSEPPSSAPKPILRPMSGGVLNGSAIFLPPPAYPETAKRMRASGVVIVDVVIDENGKVISATASSGPSTLRDAAVQAARRARFSPTKLSGQPVKVLGTISYKFSLAQ